jgi:hypothetical protein
LLIHLAAALEAIYFHSEVSKKLDTSYKVPLGKNLKCLYAAPAAVQATWLDETCIGWALYHLKLPGGKCLNVLAFRGTELGKSRVYALKIFIKMHPLQRYAPTSTLWRPVMLTLVLPRTARKKWDYICGHSLGGIIAECVPNGTFWSIFWWPWPLSRCSSAGVHLYLSVLYGCKCHPGEPDLCQSS